MSGICSQLNVSSWRPAAVLVVGEQGRLLGIGGASIRGGGDAYSPASSDAGSPEFLGSRLDHHGVTTLSPGKAAH
jgi:hypothetical protein